MRVYNCVCLIGRDVSVSIQCSHVANKRQNSAFSVGFAVLCSALVIKILGSAH